MILALDVGNTNTVVGGFEGSALRFSLRMQSDRNKTVDEYVLLLRGLLAEKEVDLSTVEGGIISSVVPELRYVLGKAMERLTGKTFLVVSSRLDLAASGSRWTFPGRWAPICEWMRRPPTPSTGLRWSSLIWERLPQCRCWTGRAATSAV